MKAFLGVGSAVVRSALALMLGLIGLGTVIAPTMASSALAAQKTGLVDDNTYVSDTSGEEITWTNTWAVDEESTFSDTDVERLALMADDGLLDVIWFPAGLDLASTRDDLFDILTDGADDTLQVDRGDYQGSSGKVSYSLDKVLVGDTELAMFTLLMERKNDTFVTVFYSTPSLFASGMASAQKSIKDDGSAIFQGIEPAGLSNALNNAPSLLDGAGSGSSKTGTSSGRTSTEETDTPEATDEETTSKRSNRDATETPEATEEETSSRSGRSSRDATETPDATEDSTGAKSSSSKKTADETPTEEDSGSRSTGSKRTSTGSDDFSDVGVIADGEYESPLYGVAVEWTDAWVIDESVDEPVSSDADSGTDEINLARADYDKNDAAQTYGALSVRFFEAGSSDTPESVVEYWTSDDYLNGGAGDGSTVLLSDATKTEGSVVLIETLESGDVLVQYLSVFFIDRGKTAVMIEFYSTDLSIADAYADAADGVTVDGAPILTLFDDRDIEKALANQ